MVVSWVVWMLIWQMQGHEEHEAGTRRTRRIQSNTYFERCLFVVFFVSPWCSLCPLQFQSLGGTKSRCEKSNFFSPHIFFVTPAGGEERISIILIRLIQKQVPRIVFRIHGF